MGPFSKSMNFVADVDLAGAGSLLHKSRRTDRKNTDKQYPELTKLALTYSTSTPAHPHTNAQKSVITANLRYTVNMVDARSLR